MIRKSLSAAAFLFSTLLAETVDLFPTLAELAGLPAPQVPQPINGLSLFPVRTALSASTH